MPAVRVSAWTNFASRGGLESLASKSPGEVFHASDLSTCRRVIPAPLCCQGRGFGTFQCAPVLVAVNVVRPVGRSRLTAPARRRGGWGAEAAGGVRGGRRAGSVGAAGSGCG